MSDQIGVACGMRNAFLAVVAALALLFTAVHSEAQVYDGSQTYWSGSGNTNGFGWTGAVGTAVTNGIIVAAGNGTPVVHWLNISGSTSNSVLVVYTNSAPKSVTFSSSTTNIYCSTNGLAVGQQLIIRYADGQCEFRAIASIPTATNVTVAAAHPVFAQAVDTTTVVYPTAPAYSFSANPANWLGFTNRELASLSGVIVGQKNHPLAVSINGVTYSAIQAAATYK